MVTVHEHLYQRSKPLALGPGCRDLRPGRFDADCLATDGAGGTTFVTVGTGGHELRVVNGGDRERATSPRPAAEPRAVVGSLTSA